MKISISTVFAALAVVLTVTAIPADVSEPLAETVELTPRATCCKYATGGQWCGPTGCCLWKKCLAYGSPASCGFPNCCFKWNC
ncbi:hypothetical protein BG011_008833 [Mortierella polycephala]|uniref:Uncharacterized protein n=1 Tax=Mortierella polycephala TaxID=41804 RepID=A0A9P6U892_9FUNG|nr:hypothetical protein BG011_008833 [Mortierella polycephala]